MMKELIIVTGTSSSGKSTFIEKYLLPKLYIRGLELNKDIDIKFAGRLYDNFDLGTKPVCIVHYNSLVKFDRYPDTEALFLREEKVFSKLLNRTEKIKVYLCYTPDNILLERIKIRNEIEPVLSPSRVKYPKDAILNKFSRIDQRQVLLQCSEEFKPITSDIQVVFSGEGKVKLMSVDEFQFALPSDKLEAIIGI